MNTIATVAIIGKASLSASMSLDEILESMRLHGLPRVSMPSKDGWHCNISMHTNAIGAEFKIASEFGLPTALAAARECYDRMQSALSALAGKG